MSDDHTSAEIRERIRTQAGNRCGYCLSPQHLVYASLEIEHNIPKAKGGVDDEGNLCLACRLCNSFKATQTTALDPLTGDRVQIFNPRLQRWSEHFAWSNDGARIIGQTPIGRATVIALQLNNLIAVKVRREWVSVGWHPPEVV